MPLAEDREIVDCENEPPPAKRRRLSTVKDEPQRRSCKSRKSIRKSWKDDLGSCETRFVSLAPPTNASPIVSHTQHDNIGTSTATPEQQQRQTPNPTQQNTDDRPRNPQSDNAEDIDDALYASDATHGNYSDDDQRQQTDTATTSSKPKTTGRSVSAGVEEGLRTRTQQAVAIKKEVTPKPTATGADDDSDSDIEMLDERQVRDIKKRQQAHHLEAVSRRPRPRQRTLHCRSGNLERVSCPSAANEHRHYGIAACVKGNLSLCRESV